MHGHDFVYPDLIRVVIGTVGSSFDKKILQLNTDYSVASKYLEELKSAT